LASWHLPGGLLLLLLTRLALGLAYSQVVPAWESYDEDGHFAYAFYLAQHQRLTLDAADPLASQIWEKFQPPLYYDLIAPAVALFDRDASFPSPPRNPYFTNGDAGVNYALHPAAASAAEIALRAARAVGVLISTLSVIAVFLAARRLWPADPAATWAATLLYAFWPQFLFVGSMVTNDVLVTALAAAAVWLSVTLALDGLHLRPAILLSIVVGAALVTKLNAAALLVLAVGALALSLRSGGAPAASRTRWRLWLGLAGLFILVVAALWALSSLNFVTGQVFRLATLRDFANNLNPSSQSANGFIVAALAYAFRTFLASYGWGNLETFSWLYWLWPVGLGLALAGFVIAVWQRRRGRQLDGPPARVYWLLAAFALTLVGLALALAISQHSIYLVPGRYLLPGLPAVALLLVGGWRAWNPPGRARRVAGQVMGLGLVLVAWQVPLQILIPAYARPQPDVSGKVDTPAGAVYGGNIELLGYDGTINAVAGGSLQARLCWQALAPIPTDNTLFLEVVGADGQGYGRLSTYPGHGNYPTSQWTPNAPFCDRYAVELGDDMPAPALAHLRVTWLVGTSGQRLPLVLPSGEAPPDPAYTLEFKVAGRPGFVPPVAHAVDYQLGQQIKLTGYDVALAGDTVRVSLRWQALSAISTNYVAFVHLRDTPAHAFAQGDGLPLSGAYPTRLWQPGEIILDPHVLRLPPGGPTPPLALYVGLYNADTQQRLPAFDANGHEVASDEIVLAQGLTFR